jgi:hypothetical protein
MLNRKLAAILAFAVFVVVFVFFVFVVPALAVDEKPKSLMITASGKGTIKVGREQFPLHSVVLKLKEEGKLELTLVSDITLFFEGSWSWADEAGKTVELKLQGGPTGALQGGGKVILRNDGNSMERMTLQASNKFRKTVVDVHFVAD